MRLALVPLLLGLLTGACSAQDDPGVYVRVRSVWTGGPKNFDSESVLYIKNGKLEAIFPADRWAASRLLPEAHVLDRRDLIAMPGLVLSQLEVGSGRREASTASARFRALDSYDPYTENRELVSKGITSAFLHPGRGRLATGEGAVVKLAGPAKGRILRARAELCFELGASILNPPLKTKIAVPSSSDVPIVPGKRQRPSSRLAYIAELRARLLAALTYETLRQTARGAERPEFDPDLQALASAIVDGRLRIDVRRATDLRAVLQLARELKLEPVIAGATEAYKALGQLKTSKALVVYEMNALLRGAAPNRGENLDRARPRADTPSRLARAGVRFALAPKPGAEADLRLLAALAVRGGLDRDDALTAITLHAAKVLGVADRIGSLIPGKDADFILVSGDPLASSTEVVETWIDGRAVYRAKPVNATVVRAGTILTAAGEPIRNGEILIRDGVIAAVGSSVPHPRGAKVIDAGADGVVTPGFIDAFGHLGYEGHKTGANANVPIHRSVAAAGPSFLRVARSGVTTVVSAPPPSGRGNRWAAGAGSRLTALKTAESKSPSDDLRRGLVLRETVGMVFDLTGSDPLAFPGMLKARLAAGKAYTGKWKKYHADMAKWKASEGKKAAAATAKRKARTWRKTDDKKDADKKGADKKDADKKDADKKDADKKDADKKDAAPKKPKKVDPISGTWSFTISGGPLPAPQSGILKIKLEDDGRTIVGLVTREGTPGELPVTGELDGTTVNMTLEAPTPFGPPKIRGELVEEDVMRGSVNIGPLSLVFDARRTARVVPEIKIKLKRRSKKGQPVRPPLDLALEPLRQVYEGRGTLALRVDHPAMALTLLKELEKRKLPVVFVGFNDADLVAAELLHAGAGVVLRPEDSTERGGRTHSMAADLARAGISVGYSSHAEDGAAELAIRALVAVQAGVSQGQALSALTLDVARLFGISDRVGSLEVGKDGDLLIWTGPPFEATSRLSSVVVGGRQVAEELE